MIPQVVASERGTAQTNVVTAILGLQDHEIRDLENQNCLERQTKEGDSPVKVIEVNIVVS